jgi:hypothetical protein
MENLKKSKDSRKGNFSEKLIGYGGLYIDIIVRSLLSFFIVIIVFSLIPFLRNLNLWVRIVLVVLIMPFLSPLFAKIKIGDKIMNKYMELLTRNPKNR